MNADPALDAPIAAAALPEAPPAQVVRVIVPVALDTAYSYRAELPRPLAPGDVVRVPFGPRETAAVVWEAWDANGPEGSNYKRVAGLVDAPPLAEPLRRFIEWVAAWTLVPRGLVLRMALRLPDPERPEAVRVGVRATGRPPARATPARTRVLEAAADGEIRTKRALGQLAGAGTSVIDGLVDDGALEAVPLPPDPEPDPDPDHAPPTLSTDQAHAAAELARLAAGRDGSVTLLEGVTGSGKTEVYFEAVAACLRAGRQALVLVPEIALTAGFLARFEARFGAKPAEWHSAVSGRRRERTARRVAAGEARVVVGARSGLFLPFRDLGLIVVDEEHEAAYKQDEGGAYHARDMAVVRAKLEGAALVLASATPSIETRVNAEGGRYGHLTLPDRYANRPMPALTAVDLRADPPPRGSWLSPPLLTAMRETMAAGEQALLFLNRRGYAPLTLCRGCGHRFGCPRCAAWLVEHRFRRALVCHHCGHAEPRPDACPSCGLFDALTPCGPGVERMAEEVAREFPEKRAVVLSSDFPGGTERLRRELAAIAAGEVDIVVGTQLVAKGHDFPGLTLVGVVDADLGLSGADPRAGERTFQILTQVAGRAGRGERPGRAMLQTYDPGQPVLRAMLSGDTAKFYAEEIGLRRRAGLPPFGRLASLLVTGRERAETEAHARALAACAEAPEEVTILGPAEAPIAVIRGRHRVRLLVRTPRSYDLQGFVRAWLARAPRPRGSLKVAIDVDPHSFL